MILGSLFACCGARPVRQCRTSKLLFLILQRTEHRSCRDDQLLAVAFFLLVGVWQLSELRAHAASFSGVKIGLSKSHYAGHWSPCSKCPSRGGCAEVRPEGSNDVDLGPGMGVAGRGLRVGDRPVRGSNVLDPFRAWG